MQNNSSNIRLLGVDPGTTVMGYSILERKGKELTVLELGVLRLEKFENHPERLKRIFERMQSLIKSYEPQVMAIEAPFYSNNVQSMLKLGRAQGVAIAAAVISGLEVVEYSPRKIKQSITGNGNASKEQVAAMLAHIVQSPLESGFLDATDALAAAVCHHFQSNSLSQSKKYSDWSGFVKDNPNRLNKK